MTGQVGDGLGKHPSIHSSAIGHRPFPSSQGELLGDEAEALKKSVPGTPSHPPLPYLK